MRYLLDHTGIVVASPAEVGEVCVFLRTAVDATVGGDPTGGYAETSVGEQTVAVHAGARSEIGRHGGTLLHVVCDDVDEAVRAASQAGLEITAPPDDLPWGRSAYVGGPHGVVLELVGSR